jgi:membrane protein DedA with SNARE-associated domain
MTAYILSMMTQYGYITVFISMVVGIIGLPLPDEFILFFAGSLTTFGKLHFGMVVCIGWVGSCIGMTVNYILGRKIGIQRISRFSAWVHISEQKLQKWSGLFQKYGAALIPIGFFVAGLRHASPIIAGASGMPIQRYLSIAYCSSLFWISTFVLLGRTFGGQWNQISSVFHHPILLICTVILFGIFVWIKKCGFKFPRKLLQQK